MPHLINLFLLLLISMAVLSCQDDDDLRNNSSLSATVLINGQPAASGISVITDPFTTELKTDAFGQVKFENIQAGRYVVYAFIPKAASGKAPVELKSAELQRVEITLVPGILIEPSVDIVTPEEGQGFSHGEEISFSAKIGDNNTPKNELTVTWQSNQDGFLNGSTTGADGNALLKTTGLSKAEHVIKVTVKNLLGITSVDSVLINTLSPPSLEISVTQAANFENTLSWTSSMPVDKFEIYRYTKTNPTPELLATASNASSSYLDNIVPFADSVFYFVKSYNTAGYSSKSNTAATKGSPLFEISAEQAEVLPGSALIYLKGGNTIHAINYETYSVAASKSFNGTIGSFHVADNGLGNELYIPNADGWLYIYDLATLVEKAKINVGVPVKCVTSNLSGVLFTSVVPSPWWEDPLRVFNRATLSLVDGGGDFDNTRLRLLPGTNALIEITRSISPVDMDYYEFSAEGVITLHNDDRYHGAHPLDPDIFKIAPVNNYVLTSSKGSIYTANSSMTYVGSLPRGSDEFSDFDFNSDGSEIYAGLSTRKAILVYDYPSLSKSREMATKGYPMFIFRKENQLIVISTPVQTLSYATPNSIGIEIHSLP